MIKLLFLDIDGVLNSDAWFDSREYDEFFIENRFGIPINTGYPEDHFDPKCLERIKRIVKETGCKIILSSDWKAIDKNPNSKIILRRHNSVSDLLSSLGVHIEKCTPSRIGMRGNEIQYVLDQIKDDYTYCILDDDNEMLNIQLNNFILVDYRFGLTDENTNKTIKILNRYDRL